MNSCITKLGSLLYLCLILTLLTSFFFFYQRYSITSMESPSIDNNYKMYPRFLSVQQTTNATNFNLMTLVIAVISVAGVSILICILCIIRCIVRIQRRFNGNHQVANQTSKQTYGTIIPQINYAIFVEKVGPPLQNSCAICLQQFVQSRVQVINNQLIFTQTDQIRKEESGKKVNISGTEGDVQYYENVEAISNANKEVKLTVCAHLLHSSCLNVWLQKQQICPLCRQSLSITNLSKWEKLLSIKILGNTWSFQNQKEKKETSSNIQLSYNSLRREKQQITQQQTQYPTKLKGLINFYLTVMNFHKGLEKASLDPKHQEQLCYEANNIYCVESHVDPKKKSQRFNRESLEVPLSADQNRTKLNSNCFYNNHSEIIHN